MLDILVLYHRSLRNCILKKKTFFSVFFRLNNFYSTSSLLTPLSSLFCLWAHSTLLLWLLCFSVLNFCLILLYIFYFFAETLHLPTCSNSIHLNLLKHFQNSCQILPMSTLASVDHLFPCEFILPCFFIFRVIFRLYSGYFEYYVMRCWTLFKSYGNFEYFCFSISMHNMGHAQEFTNKFQSHFLEVLLSEIFSELPHFLELPLSVLQPESWGFIYSTLLQSLVAAHMSGAKMWRTERDNKNEGFSSILEAQLLWSKRKIPLLQNFRFAAVWKNWYFDSVYSIISGRWEVSFHYLSQN